MGIKFLTDKGISFLTDFGEEIKVFSERFEKALLVYSTTKATEIKAYMKKNRPWTDRTGEAKRRLNTSVAYEKGDDESIITLAHGVNYGIDLEMKHEGRYAILKPTIQHFSPIIMNDLQDFFNDV